MVNSAGYRNSRKAAARPGIARAGRKGAVAGAGSVLVMPELPEELAALVADLERLGFEVEREEWRPWPAGGEVQLRRPTVRGATRVRMSQDRGAWDVDIEIDRGWYEPFTALRALETLLTSRGVK